MDLDARIGALYALPLSEFTAERNALVKTLKGNPAAATVKALAKPSVLAWAINQLYWHERALFDRVMKAGKAARASQIARLEGRAGHSDPATSEHRAALAAAATAAHRRATAAGVNAPTDSLSRMLETVSTAAELPAQPGRFVEVVQPAGFEALLGIAAAPAPAPAAVKLRPDEPHGNNAARVSASAPRNSPSEKGPSQASKALEQQRQHAAALATAQAEELKARHELGEAEKAEARARTHVEEARARLGVAEDGLSIATRATAEARRRLEKATRILSSLE